MTNLKLFAPWFPLGETWSSLYNLGIRGSSSHFRDETDQTPIFTSPCPTLRRFELVLASPLASLGIVSILSNVSNFASITHLNIEASEEVGGIFTCLSSFDKLEYLHWRLCGSSNPPPPEAETQFAPLSLPQLKTLIVAGDSVMRALSSLDAPIVQVLHLSESWTELGSFPSLQKLTCAHWIWEVDYDVDAILPHTNLTETIWVVRAPEIARLLLALSVRMGRRPIQPSLNTLKWLNIVCSAPFPDEMHPEDNGYDTDIVRHLKGLFVCRDALHRSRRPHFKVRLNHDLVNSSTKIAELVKHHPDIESGDVDENPPGFDATFEEEEPVS